jgi:hypothetical protein
MTNPQINVAVDRAAADVLADNTIKGIAVLAGQARETIATISRDELPKFRHDPNAPPADGLTRTRSLTTTLVIHTPVLEGKAKWKFIFDGHTISADIRDHEFMGKVSLGEESFAAGDRLEVELTVTEEFDNSLATYKAAEHAVLRVRKHTKKPKQQLLPHTNPEKKTARSRKRPKRKS